MNLPFPSDAWVKAMMDDVNNSSDYEDAGKNWEGDFYFIIQTDDTYEGEAVLYMDLWHGKCRDAFLVEDPDSMTPAFRLSGPMKNWKRVMTKQLDPMQASGWDRDSGKPIKEKIQSLNLDFIIPELIG